MIAVASSGKRFGALADYLTESRHDVERVDWTSTRNLAVDDPELAARIMHATAAENVRVEKPVYHVAVSFHPDDVVTREQMEAVADHLLDALKLREYQTLIVAHNDRAHAHFHLMVNRIHPETGRAWDRWQDYVVTQRVMREEERALGLREVPGRLHQLDGQTAPERSLTTSGEHRHAARTWTEPLIERAQALAPELRAARSWHELEAQLAAHGLSVERKEQGLVFTDGEHQVKASRVHRDLSFGQFEQRLGSYDRAHEDRGARDERPDTHASDQTHVGMERHASLGAADRASGRLHESRAADPARRAADLMETASRLRAVTRGIEQARDDLVTARTSLAALERTADRAQYTSTEFDHALAGVYAKPAEARARFDALVQTDGIDRATQAMTDRPETLGTLRPTERTTWFGLVTTTEYRTAHDRAGAAAARGYEAARADEQLRVRLPDHRPGSCGRSNDNLGDPYAHAAAALGRQIKEAEGRLETLTTRRETLPSRGELLRDIRATVRDLSRSEMSRFASLVTAPQRALALRIVNAGRDALLGREGR